MNVEFILVASGNVVLRKINHAIFAQSPESAKREAEQAVAALHKAGFFQFTLYDTRRENGAADIEIASFSVTENEPTISIK